MKINRQFEKRGPLYVPRYERERVRPFERYRRRWQPRASFVQGNDYSFSTTPFTNAFKSANTKGNALIAFFEGVGTSGGVSFLDSNENFWHTLYSGNGSPVSGQVTGIGFAFNCKAGANTVTANAPGVTGSNIGGVAIGEYSGFNALDSNSNATFTGTSGYTGTASMTTQFPNETCIAFFIFTQGYDSVSSPFTFENGIESSPFYYEVFADNVGVSIGSQTATGTAQNNSGTVYVLLAGFFQAAFEEDAFKPFALRAADQSVSVW